MEVTNEALNHEFVNNIVAKAEILLNDINCCRETRLLDSIHFVIAVKKATT